MLSLYLNSELFNTEICSYLIGLRTFKTKSNADVDLPRIHDVATSMT